MAVGRVNDRVSLLEGKTFWESHASPDLGLRSLFFSDGPHGLRRPKSGTASGIGDSLPATCFPTASALAASWDRELVEEVGAAIGREARALGVDVVLGPGLNIERSPLCGRNFEYFSEDPRLAGELAGAMVRGIQSNGVSACLKHFAVNNQEDHRMVVDAIVDERTLREIYLRAFEIAVDTGAPWAVMAAYNKVNGAYACENEALIDRILRGEWGFDGVVLSDWGAVSDSAASVAAGLDLAMPTMRGAHAAAVREGLREGRVGPTAIDASVARLVALAERTASREDAPSKKSFDERAHHAIARRAASRCCVLLRNEESLLPLDPGSSRKVALVGALAKTPRYQGAGSSGVVPTRLTNVHDAMTSAFGTKLRYAPGYRLDDRDDPDLVTEAVRIARESDVVVVVLGLPPVYESEAFDREHLDLPRVQTALVEAVAQTRARVVVVLCNGAAITMPWADRVSAVLEAYLGGQAAGEAITDVITGAVNPSGKLAETFALALSDHPSSHWFPGDGQHAEYREALYVGYRWFDTANAPVRFPFGHGLSYTSFALSDLTARTAADDDTPVEVDVTIENTGSRRGAEVVQLYVHDVEHTVVRPEQELAAFARVALAPGEKKRITLRLERRAFAFWDVRGKRWAVEAGAFELRIGTSSRAIHLRTTIDVASTDGPFERDMPEAYVSPKAPLRIDRSSFEELLGRALPSRAPLRPFTRETPLGALRDSRVGDALCRGARAQARKDLERAGDPALAKFAERMVTELPLRGIVTLSAKMGWRELDALIDTLNGRPLAALRRFVRRS